MKIYNIFVPRSEYHRAKDLCTVIHNILRKRDWEISEDKLNKQIAKTIRERYTAAGGVKSLLEILTEYRREL